MSDRGVRWGTLALLSFVGVYCLLRLELTNTILHFIPSRAEAELVELSLELVESPLAQRMTLSVEGGRDARSLAAALAEKLRGHPEVAWVETGIDDSALRDLFALYFERRLYLVSDRPAVEIPARLTPEALAARAERLKARLAQPDSALVSRVAPADPLGLFEDLLARTSGFSRASVSSASAWQGATLQLGLRSSPFDSVRQSALLADIESAFAELSEAGEPTSPPPRLEQSGVNRYAVATERSVRGDVNTISGLSLPVVCALFVLVFRSLRRLLVAVLVPLGGFGFALAVALSTGEPIHGITLGFGFVLVGVAIDYPIHLMNHAALSRSVPRESRRRLRSSLLASGLTTALAFSSLALSDFPGLSEMGSFAALGVPVALGLAMLSLPAFLPETTRPTRTQEALAGAFNRLVVWLRRHRRAPLALCLGVAGVAVVGIPRLRWQDDPATLMTVDPALHAESERVRRRVVDFDGGRFVVGLAADPQRALSLNAEINTRLQRAVAAGELDAVGSLHAFLWPEALQRENLATFRAVPDLGGRIDRAYSRAGFRKGAFDAFTEAVAAPKAQPLRVEDLAASPLARALDSLVELEGRWAVVTYLRGVRSGAAICAVLDGLPGVHYVDQREILAEVYASYRRSAIRTVVSGAVVVLLVLLLRYRRFSSAVLAFLPAALATAGTLGVLGLAEVAVNVVSAVSLLVVLGMGVDYGIFAVDTAARDGDAGVTLSSLAISCTTTVFVFGVLALSSQPALRAIGLATGIGVTIALALAPGILALASSRRGAE